LERVKLYAALLLAATASLATIAFLPVGSAQDEPTADAQVRRIELGRSSRGRALTALEIAARDPRRRPVLVVGCIHGNECAGIRVTQRLAALGRRARSDLWLVHDLNPDGHALGRRQNARGVDLNRNFPAGWRATGKPWDPYYPGTRPLSEPETRAIARLIGRIRPRLTIWFHQPEAVVRAWGRSIGAGRRYARLSGEPFRELRWPPGSASHWQNRRLGATSFVVELSPGPLSRAAARRHANAIVALAG
jgi:murein peptide amidase A